MQHQKVNENTAQTLLKSILFRTATEKKGVYTLCFYADSPDQREYKYYCRCKKEFILWNWPGYDDFSSWSWRGCAVQWQRIRI